MANTNETSRIAAETLVSALTAGGAALATSLGAPIAVPAVAAAVIMGVFKLIHASIPEPTDHEQIVRSIQEGRTSASVEMLRDALLEVMRLKPELRSPIEALAAAVRAEEYGEDDALFRQALGEFFKQITQATAHLEDIKSDTRHIPSMADNVAAISDDVTAIRRTLEGRAVQAGSNTSVGDPTPGRVNYLEMKVESLRAEVRELLDSDGRDKWDRVTAAMAAKSWTSAFDAAEALERWLVEQGDKLSAEVKVQCWLTLADVALIRDSGAPFGDRRDVGNAYCLLTKAEAAADSSVSSQTAERLLRVRAKLRYVDGDPQGARELVAGLHDPAAISLLLGFLIEENRWQEASELAQSQSEPHGRWADFAILAHVHANEAKRAEDLLAWSRQQDEHVKKKCLLAWVKSRYSLVLKSAHSGRFVCLDDDSRQTIQELREQLSVGFVVAFAGGPQDGLDAEALEIGILVSHILRDRGDCGRIAQLLAQWWPVVPELGRAALRQDIPPMTGLADRFLAEHPKSHASHLMAAILLTECEGAPSRALGLLDAMLENSDELQRVEVSRAMLVAAQYCTPEQAVDTERRVGAVLGAQHRITRMIHVIALTKRGSHAEASDELRQLQDTQDHIWLELTASVAIQAHDWIEAARTLRVLGELTGHPEVFRREAEAWFRAGRLSEVIAPLEQTYRLLPDDFPTAHNLAGAYHQLERFTEAVILYERLWDLEVHSDVLALNYSSCLVQVGRADDAIDVLQTRMGEAPADVSSVVVIKLSHLLHAKGDSRAALAALVPHWSRLRGDHKYLLALLQMGYAAGSDGETHAHMAFQDLMDRLHAGTLPEGILTGVSLDDLRTVARGVSERRQETAEHYLSGKLPWLLASKLTDSGAHSLLAWHIRTQAGVTADDPLSLAAFSIYSTNGFTASSVDGARRLVPIVAAPKRADVVIDMSALITLHRLGLLRHLAATFGTVYLPQSYRTLWLDEQSRIPHHQPSQIEARRAIIHAIDTNEIAIEPRTPHGNVVLDEYVDAAEDGCVVVRVGQVLQWLVRKGRLSQQDASRFRTDRDCLSLTTDSDVEDLLREETLLAAPLTLTSLHESGLLEHFLREFNVRIEPDEARRLRSELRGQEESDRAGQWYRDLINEINTLRGIRFEPAGHGAGDESDDSDPARPEIQLAIDAALLAQQLKVPLLADDRRCQQSALSDAAASPWDGFGTDALLSRWATDGVIDVEQHADCLLQLMSWRYKFIVPPVNTLLTMAARFNQGLPGAQLRQVALYLQDSMRDFGLYGGQENVDPPMSMAMRLWTAWMDTITRFATEVWWDDRFTESQATRLTRWITRYMCPPWPRNLPVSDWQRVSRIRRFALMSGMLSQLLQKPDVRRASRAFMRVRRSIGPNDAELAAVAKSVDGVIDKLVVEGNEAAARHLFLHVGRIMHGQVSTFDWRLLPMACTLGFIDPESASQRVPVNLATIADRRGADTVEVDPGPYAFLQCESGRAAVFLPEVLPAPSAEIRCAALDTLQSMEQCPKSVPNQTALNAVSAAIRRADVGAWVPAVEGVLDDLVADFDLNIAGFAQCRGREYEAGMGDCWARLIRPEASALLALQGDGWEFLLNDGEAHDALPHLLRSASNVHEFLGRYDRLAGHLTTAPPLDLGSNLKEFLQSHQCANATWGPLEEWLHDQLRPWRRYHACQALLTIPSLVPSHNWTVFWESVTEIAELVQAMKANAAAAQVWRLEAELAGHYLRTVDLGGFGLEENRPLTVAWYAARRITELMVGSLEPAEAGEQIRTWRQYALRRPMEITRDTWMWVGPRGFTASRSTTLETIAPRSIALLVAIGAYAKEVGLDAVPPDCRTRLRDALLAGMLFTPCPVTGSTRQLWMWDRSMRDATTCFMSALPDGERIGPAAQALEIAREAFDPTTVENGLKELPNVGEHAALFICSVVRAYCYWRRSDAAAVLLPFFRDPEWRRKCVLSLPVTGWELLGHALLAIQRLQQPREADEVGYVFLKLAEVSVEVEDKCTMFLALLVIAASNADSLGALRAIRQSESASRLKRTFGRVRGRIDELMRRASPAISVRLQAVATVLDQI